MSNENTGQIVINQVSIELNEHKIGNTWKWTKSQRGWNQKYENGTKLKES